MMHTFLLVVEIFLKKSRHKLIWEPSKVSKLLKGVFHFWIQKQSPKSQKCSYGLGFLT